MSDFDPDAFLAATSPGFDPDAFLAATPALAAGKPKTGLWRALALGARQGGSLGFADEAGAGLQALLHKASGDEGTLGDFYRRARDENRAEEAQAETDQPGAYLAGNVAGGAVLPGGAGGLVGKLGMRALPKAGAALAALGSKAGRLGRAAVGAGGLGAAYGAGASEADTVSGLARDTALGGALGGGAGVLGAGVAKGGEALTRAGGRLLARAQAKAAEMGAKEAAEATGSARSLAGRTAQDAYRQLENLRDTGALRTLTGAEQEAAEALTAELAGKSARNLPGSIGAKEAASAALTEAAQTETERAAAIAAEKLRSTAGKDALSFARSYGEPLVGGAVGGALGEELFDSPGVGIALGATVFGRTRAAKALRDRLAKPGNRAVLARAMEKLGRGVTGRQAAAASRAFTPPAANFGVPAWAQREDEETQRARMLAALLRGDTP